MKIWDVKTSNAFSSDGKWGLSGTEDTIAGLEDAALGSPSTSSEP
jgi:hypothetical protein